MMYTNRTSPANFYQYYPNLKYRAVVMVAVAVTVEMMEELVAMGVVKTVAGAMEVHMQ